MYYIDTVKIEGFWGDKSVEFKLNSNQNFLIGVNGSGKTTIINLIAATITADGAAMEKILFDKITLSLLTDENKKHRPKIIVTKSEVGHSSHEVIIMKIRYNSNKIIEGRIDEDDNIFFRRNYELKTSKVEQLMLDKEDMKNELNNLFNVSWLSIHRYKKGNKAPIFSDTSQSLIDQKINQFSTDLLKYLSLLNRKATIETNKFQKIIFLSLITQDNIGFDSLFNKIDLDEEKEALTQVYQLFDVHPSEYKTKINKYWNEYKKAKNKFDGDGITIYDANFLLGIERIHAIIQEWNNLKTKEEEIFRSKTIFLKVINNLLQRKDLIINAKNELKIETQSGKILDLDKLSSGEKQLLIILGEALLQESIPHIYIADEPELSLHIDWQETLVDNLKSLNPNCQVIFATHSPDIVSHYSKSVIKIENCIK